MGNNTINSALLKFRPPPHSKKCQMFSQARYSLLRRFLAYLRCKSIKICPVRFFMIIAIFAPKFTTKRAATRHVTGLYLSTAADKARQRPWRRPPGSKAARQAGIGWSSPLGGGLRARRAPMAVLVTGNQIFYKNALSPIEPLPRKV